jgi:hypothetical protein
MENNHHISQELQEISPVVANLNRGIVYSVPPTYFEYLAEDILQKIRATDFFVKNNPFSMPQEDYFQNLATNILARVRQGERSDETQDELVGIAPLLNTIGRHNPYTIPKDYFNNLTIAPPAIPAKIVSLGSRKKWYKYAVAAAVSALMVTGAVKFIGSNKIDVDKELSKTSDTEIEQYLQQQTSVGYILNAVEPTNEESEEQALFEGVSDDEMKNYLEENS